MRAEELEIYNKIENEANMLRIQDIPRPLDDRTLVYGYNSDPTMTVHCYVEGGKLHLLRYDHDQIETHYESGDVLSISGMLPYKRAYPDACDFETCALIAKRGINISFTTFNKERLEAQFYGKRRQDLVPTAPNILEMRGLLHDLRVKYEAQLRADYVQHLSEEGRLYDQDDYGIDRHVGNLTMEYTNPMRIIAQMALNKTEHDQWTPENKEGWEKLKASLICGVPENSKTPEDEYRLSILNSRKQEAAENEVKIKRFEELAAEFGVTL